MLSIFRPKPPFRAEPVITPPRVQALEFINPIAASCSLHEGHLIDEGYRYLVQFFRCALLDRTETLQPGFPYRILDPIPHLETNVADLTELCDRRARELLAEARTEGKTIKLLWSGGIDSTTTLVALLKAAKTEAQRECIEVVYSNASVGEYRRFFKKIVKPNFRLQKIKTIQEALDPQALIVTGEHGDQIFGSVLAADYLRPAGLFRAPDKRLFSPWQNVIVDILDQRLKNQRAANLAYRTLSPLLEQCPIRIDTLFDLLWWVNFSAKWQLVSLRIASYAPDHYYPLRQALRHFFRTDDFQRWSLANHDLKIEDHWASYKMPLKNYINDYFPDANYRNNKLKKASLNRLITPDKARIYDVNYGLELHYESGTGDACADDGGE